MISKQVVSPFTPTEVREGLKSGPVTQDAAAKPDSKVYASVFALAVVMGFAGTLYAGTLMNPALVVSVVMALLTSVAGVANVLTAQRLNVPAKTRSDYEAEFNLYWVVSAPKNVHSRVRFIATALSNMDADARENLRPLWEEVVLSLEVLRLDPFDETELRRVEDRAGAVGRAVKAHKSFERALAEEHRVLSQPIPEPVETAAELRARLDALRVSSDFGLQNAEAYVGALESVRTSIER